MKHLLLLFTFLSIVINVYSQKKKSIDDIKYQRNSLSTFLVSDGNYENKDKVLQSYKNYEFPDKYNDHRISLNDLDLSSIVFNDEEIQQFNGIIFLINLKRKFRTELISFLRCNTNWKNKNFYIMKL